MAQVAHVPHMPRAGTTAIVACVIGAGAAIGVVAITGNDLGSQPAAASQPLPAGAAFVQPAPTTTLSAPATAALHHTPR
jgi:hypothetical protein